MKSLYKSMTIHVVSSVLLIMRAKYSKPLLKSDVTLERPLFSCRKSWNNTAYYCHSETSSHLSHSTATFITYYTDIKRYFKYLKIHITTVVTNWSQILAFLGNSISLLQLLAWVVGLELEKAAREKMGCYGHLLSFRQSWSGDECDYRRVDGICFGAIEK